MTRLMIVLLVVLATVWFCMAAINPDMRGQPLDECGPCDRDLHCKEALDCEVGIVKDKCGCCDACAKKEYELCEHPEVFTQAGVDNGKCGENLECKLRNDLEDSDPDEAVCYCTMQDYLCGSDGVSYVNICELAAAGVRKGEKITIDNKGPCKSGKSSI